MVLQSLNNPEDNSYIDWSCIYVLSLSLIHVKTGLGLMWIPTFATELNFNDLGSS